MPTILRIGSLRVSIYPNDHRPAHIHVVGNGGEAVFLLHCPDGPLELRESYGFRQSELTRIREELDQHLQPLCTMWRTYHGHY